MPRWDNVEEQIAPASGYKFSAMRVDTLEGASEYTLATIAIDSSGSLGGLETELNEMFKNVVSALKKSSRSENIMLRVLSFTRKINELNGFVTVNSMDENSLPEINPYGRTALYDATADAIGASMKYSEDLLDQDYDNNSIIFIITDGADNESTNRPADIKKMVENYKKMELDSLQTVLIGLNTSECGDYLKNYTDEANLDIYLDAGDATPDAIAKVTGIVSKSVVSSSQSLGTGKPANLSIAI